MASDPFGVVWRTSAPFVVSWFGPVHFGSVLLYVGLLLHILHNWRSTSVKSGQMEQLELAPTWLRWSWGTLQVDAALVALSRGFGAAQVRASDDRAWALFVSNPPYDSALCLVVLCPYLRTSEGCRARSLRLATPERKGTAFTRESSILSPAPITTSYDCRTVQ